MYLIGTLKTILVVILTILVRKIGTIQDSCVEIG